MQMGLFMPRVLHSDKVGFRAIARGSQFVWHCDITSLMSNMSKCACGVL